MDYKGIIFDLDGTLIDSVGDICLFANQALEKYGYPTHTIDNYIDWIGNGARQLMLDATPKGLDEETFNKLFAEYLEIYELAEHTESVLYDGITELLDKLTDQYTPICILTNKPHAVMLQTLKSYFSTWTFDIALGQREGLPKKPDPTYALQIAKDLGLAPEEIIFIGDSAVDVKTGKAAGMQTICIEAGYETKENIADAQPTVIIKEHTELLSLLIK